MAGGGELKARMAEVRLYVLLTESLCVRGWEETLDAILGCGGIEAAGSGVGGDESRSRRLCIQLREKTLPDGELLRRARVVADKCRRAGAVSIINDRPEIAMLAGADGVHVGQTDLACREIRKLCGSRLIVGVSTENLDQARTAVRDGATYIGAGPMFPTTTKDKSHLPALPGPDYAAAALGEIPLPIIPIGGITLANLPQLTTRGVRAVAVCSAIIAAPDPGAAGCAFLQALSH
jgi:thiamine-phosphate pyrophosphorylase